MEDPIVVSEISHSPVNLPDRGERFPQGSLRERVANANLLSEPQRAKHHAAAREGRIIPSWAYQCHCALQSRYPKCFASTAPASGRVAAADQYSPRREEIGSRGRDQSSSWAHRLDTR